MLQLQLFEPMQERQIAKGIHSLSDINDDVSQKVRAQYEENPYPRWRSVLRKDHNKNKTQLSQKLQDKNILIAGCGTGSHILMVRDENPIGHITALDLSMASLSYAKRKITEMDLLEDIRFIHGDILNVAQLDEEFDHIESAGVLHHMEDPLKGWKELVKLLKPGGTMKIGLYSEAARRAVVEMRNVIQEQNFPHDLDGIRAARQYVMDSAQDSVLHDLLVFRDFFSTSSCRDLIFHVQEHRYTIDRLKEELDILGLEFVEMYFSATVHRNAYVKMFPDDPHCRNLDYIKAFEEKTPETFRGMYQFKLIKPA
jgi:ubiquinone/menaquinone biosynthesis C-methylase UbiE